MCWRAERTPLLDLDRELFGLRATGIIAALLFHEHTGG
jgi:hypothetical protein